MWPLQSTHPTREPRLAHKPLHGLTQGARAMGFTRSPSPAPALPMASPLTPSSFSASQVPPYVPHASNSYFNPLT